MNQNSFISVITVNYNGYNDTCHFIESWINNINACQYEIIVIDNGSVNDESILIKKKYPQIISYRSDRNLGFAGANNIGISLAKGNFLFFLNNDTIIINDIPEQFIERLKNDDIIAGFSPLILNNDCERSIQYAGLTRLSDITLRNKSVTDIKTQDDLIQTSYLHGAAMLFKRQAIEEVGLMDENYFLYYEELDWCEKFKRKGYKLYVNPSLSIIHKNSGTIGLDNPLKAYYLTRNRLLFAYNNRSKNKLFFIILYHILFAYPYHIIKALYNRRIDIAKAEIKGIIDYFKLTI